MTHVLSEPAEVATRLLFQTVGGHKATMLTIPGRAPDSRFPQSQVDLEQIQRQATLLRLVSITESYCAEQLLSRAELALPSDDNALYTLIWDAAALDATRTWVALKDAFKRWFGANPDWTKLDGLAEARNAIAHGLGSLTRQQQGKRQSTMTKLNRTGILVDNNALILTDGDLTRAAVVCRSVIAEVDALP